MFIKCSCKTGWIIIATDYENQFSVFNLKTVTSNSSKCYSEEIVLLLKLLNSADVP